LTSLILGTATRLLMPLLLLFSIFLLLRGHNSPGGGFAGGLVAAAAFVLYSIAANVPTTRLALRFEPQNFIGFGLLCAIFSGLPALLFGQPYLTAWWGQVKILDFVDIKLGTPLLFDIGVYLVVLGVMLKILLPLEEEAETQSDEERDFQVNDNE
jgi:multicomponent Na+:H+ antiporter subunit B